MEENRPSFDHDNREEKVQENKDAVKKEAKGFFKSIATFFKELVDFRDDTDRESTIELIKADIPFKGATTWILICSIFIASIGLNANSIPVVIGAMLISPLMGPILGMGMSIAINDVASLRKSIINFLVMVLLSIATAWLFFWLFPLKAESSELLARTKPDIRDVLIAFFGGLALIIARTKKGTIASVIFGVAIATALMPPLCTVGFGLAVKNWQYAIGAMYLFTINTIFIALATFLVLKILRFPMSRYANSARRKFTARFASFIALLVMVPAIYTFYIALQESNFENDYESFIETVENNEELNYAREFHDYDEKVIRVFFNGEVPDAARVYITNEMKSYENLEGFDLDIKAAKTGSLDQLSKANDRYLEEINKLENERKKHLEQIEELNGIIAGMENERNSASLKNVPFLQLSKDAKINFPGLDRLGYGSVLLSNFRKMDTITTVFPIWKSRVSNDQNTARNSNLKAWMEKELKVKDVFLKE